MKTTKIINYKGYKIEVCENESYIYLNGALMGCTYTDDNKNNSEEKAKKRIDNNKINLLSNN